MADPGFPRGGAPTPEGTPTYYLANFFQKLHENEEISGQRGARVPRAPLWFNHTGLLWDRNLKWDWEQHYRKQWGPGPCVM